MMIKTAWSDFMQRYAVQCCGSVRPDSVVDRIDRP